MRKLFIILPLLFASQAFAASGTITKNAKPGNIYGTADAVSYANFSILSSDFPSGTLNLTKTITSVQYTWYHYQNGTTVKVELCYDRPYQATHQYCTDVSGAQTGSSTAFNSLQFGAGSTFYLKHTIGGPNSPKLPSTSYEQVKVNYNY